MKKIILASATGEELLLPVVKELGFDVSYRTTLHGENRIKKSMRLHRFFCCTPYRRALGGLFFYRRCANAGPLNIFGFASA
jgi:hypothetical protein